MKMGRIASSNPDRPREAPERVLPGDVEGPACPGEYGFLWLAGGALGGQARLWDFGRD